MNEEEIIAAARNAAEQRGIVFIDEFDKLVDPKGIEFACHLENLYACCICRYSRISW